MSNSRTDTKTAREVGTHVGLAYGREWPEERAEALERMAGAVLANVRGLDVLGTLRALGTLTEYATDVATAIIEIAGEETKLTQRAMEDALGVKRGTLRGLRRGRR